MKCPVCDFSCEKHAAASHLPRFFRCPNCSGYYQKCAEQPFYPNAYFTDSPGRRRSVFQRLLNIFLFLRLSKIERVLPRQKSAILDYGCGNGKFVSYLKEKGFDVEGYDPSLSAVALAQRNNLPVYDKIPDKKYELIMFWHSLEHSDQPFAELVACKNYLASGAKIIVAVPNGDSLEARFCGENWFCYDWPFHHVHFNPRAIKILLGKAGFHMERIDYFNPEYTFSSLAQTFLNLLLPKNVFYSLVSNRRPNQDRARLLILGLVSFAALIIFSPILLLVFVAELITKKTAAFIVVAANKKVYTA